MLYNPKKSDSFKKYGNGSTIAQQLRTSSESLQQIHFFRLLYIYAKKHPILNRIYAIPNGGYRSIKTAVTLKAEGCKSGVWDIFVPIPKNGKAGLYVEMKWTSGLSKEQKDFRDNMIEHYDFAVCYFGDEAMDLIKEYLG